MNRLIFLLVGSFLVLPAKGENPSQNRLPGSEKYREYLAGVELLTNDRYLADKVKAAKYRELCKLTGVDAALATAFIKQYFLEPAQWQKVQSSVLELLQALK